MTEYVAKYKDDDGNVYRVGFPTKKDAVEFLGGQDAKEGKVLDEDGVVVWEAQSEG